MKLISWKFIVYWMCCHNLCVIITYNIRHDHYIFVCMITDWQSWKPSVSCRWLWNQHSGYSCSTRYKEISSTGCRWNIIGGKCLEYIKWLSTLKNINSRSMSLRTVTISYIFLHQSNLNCLITITEINGQPKNMLSECSDRVPWTKFVIY